MKKDSTQSVKIAQDNINDYNSIHTSNSDNINRKNSESSDKNKKNDKYKSHTANSILANQLMCKHYPLPGYDVGSTTQLLHRCIRFTA